jgi:D-aspartate ligase
MDRLDELHEALTVNSLARDSAVPVLVLKIGRYILHHGTVGIIRSLGRMGVPVFSIVEDRFTPAAVCKYVTGTLTWETQGLDAKKLLDGMAIIGERLNRPTILVPTDDVAAILIAEQAATLQRWFLFPQQPVLLPRTLANKRELYLLCKQIGVSCPEAVFPNSMDDVYEFVQHATFPVVVKAAESWLLPAGARTTSIAWTREQACAFYRDTQAQQHTQGQHRPNLIFQQYIPPGCSEDWFYHGYCNQRSDSCIGFTGRKIRSYPCFAGPTTLGKAVSNEPLRQQAETILKSLSYSGIMDIDFRLDKRDGQYKLLDFNPRIGAQFRLFEDHAGTDVVRALYLDLTGKRVPRSPEIKGRTFIVELHDLAASITSLRRGTLTVREWWRSLYGKKELAWLSRDDPLPFLMMCVRLLLRVIERMLRIRRTPNLVNQIPHWQNSWRTSFHKEPAKWR